MKNPFGPDPDSFNSYQNTKQRILAIVRMKKVYEQIFAVVKVAYEDAINTENIALSREERKHLFAQILRLLLEDMIQKLDDSSEST
ncbi:MAG TPA: hypothetical protein VLT51_04490 [Anaerolineales bacterium]|nr:hypothetical protein [Anaerolineales bacterium]